MYTTSYVISGRHHKQTTAPSDRSGAAQLCGGALPSWLQALVLVKCQIASRHSRPWRMQLVWMDVGGGWDGREHQGKLQTGCGSLCGPSQGAVGAGMARPGGSGCQRHLLDVCCHQCPHKRHSRYAAECQASQIYKDSH